MYFPNAQEGFFFYNNLQKRQNKTWPKDFKGITQLNKTVTLTIETVSFHFIL